MGQISVGDPGQNYSGANNGFHAVPAAVSKTCLVRFDNNKYLVMAKALGRPVEVHADAERIVIRQDGEVIAEHARCFGRGQTVYDPWHYRRSLINDPRGPLAEYGGVLPQGSCGSRHRPLPQSKRPSSPS